MFVRGAPRTTPAAVARYLAQATCSGIYWEVRMVPGGTVGLRTSRRREHARWVYVKERHRDGPRLTELLAASGQTAQYKHSVAAGDAQMVARDLAVCSASESLMRRQNSRCGDRRVMRPGQTCRPPTSFVGRDSELAALRRLSGSSRDQPGRARWEGKNRGLSRRRDVFDVVHGRVALIEWQRSSRGCDRERAEARFDALGGRRGVGRVVPGRTTVPVVARS